ncbi:hypothetical protein VH571_14975 [Frondihabitans sp. 4ASC-45]|uniref:hypothetical protein n=1 Tax=Frondihabitans sp. 4ASC-45 TaxID=3111636 RepID=UPI003C1416BD
MAAHAADASDGSMDVLVQPVDDSQSLEPQSAAGDADQFKEDNPLFWLKKYAEEAYLGSDLGDAEHPAKWGTLRAEQFNFDGITMGPVSLWPAAKWTSEKVGKEQPLSGYTRQRITCPSWKLYTDHPSPDSSVITREVVGRETSAVDVGSLEKSFAPGSHTKFQDAIATAMESDLGIKDETGESQFLDHVAAAWATATGKVTIIRSVSKAFGSQIPYGDQLRRPVECTKLVTEFFDAPKTVTLHVWQRIDGNFTFDIPRDARDEIPDNAGNFHKYKVTMSAATALSGLSDNHFPDQSGNTYRPYQLGSRDHLASQTLDFPYKEFRVLEHPGQPATVEVHRTVEVTVPHVYPKTTLYEPEGRGQWSAVPIIPPPDLEPPFKFNNPWQGSQNGLFPTP